MASQHESALIRVFGCSLLCSLTLVLGSLAGAANDGPDLVRAAVSPGISSENCEIQFASHVPITYGSLLERALEKIRVIEAQTPLPEFISLRDEASRNWQGLDPQGAPRALQESIGRWDPEAKAWTGAKFMRSPAYNAEGPGMVKLLDSQGSIPFHWDHQWRGLRTSTDGWLMRPFSSETANSQFLIGNQYQKAAFHWHGGGTPTASGVNAVSIGAALGKRGVPLISVDMPGHGRGSRLPMLDLDEQATYMLDLMDEMIHPDVRMTPMGHSWGAMIAVYLYLRQLTHPDDPRYKRIDRFIAISPGVEVPEEYEEWFDANFHQYQDRIAEGDFEFLDNILQNGKLSTLALWYFALTSKGYKTPVLSGLPPEKLARLKVPITVIMGQNDGLVFVGREEIARPFFQSLPAPSNYIELGPGVTFKSKNKNDRKKTGHQVFDLQRDDTEPGEGGHLVPHLIAELIFGAGRDELQMQLTRQRREREDREEGGAEALLDRYDEIYGNNFVFREYIERAWVTTRGQSDYRDQLESEKREINEYLNSVRRLDRKAERDRIRNEAIARARTEVGIAGRLSLESARAELDTPPPTPEERADLERYVGEVNAMKERLRESDGEFQRELANLNEQYRDVIEELGVTNAREARRTLDSSGEEGDERPAVERATALRDAYDKLERDLFRRLGKQFDQEVAQIPTPSRASDFRAARRLLDLDFSEERVGRVTRFLEIAPRNIESDIRSYDEQIDVAARGFRRPQALLNLSTVPEASRTVSEWIEIGERRVLEIEQHLDERFVPTLPEGSNPETVRKVRELSQIINDRDAAQAEFDFINRGSDDKSNSERAGGGKVEGLQALEKRLVAQRAKHDKLLKRITALLTSPELGGESLAQWRQEYDRRLEVYAQRKIEARDLINNAVKALGEDMEAIRLLAIRSTPQIEAALRSFKEAKAQFMDWKGMRDGRVMALLQSGALEGPEATMNELRKLLRELNGSGNGGPDSASGSLAALETHVEELRQRASLAIQRVERLEERYFQQLEMLDLQGPVNLRRWRLWDLVNRPREQLLNDMKRDPLVMEALRRGLTRWDVLWRPFRASQQATSASDGIN